MYLAKDFIETSEGLVFAVVESGEENGKVLCFLRYFRNNENWEKLNTAQANLLLRKNYPEYYYYSKIKQAHCHAVALDKVDKHHKPRKRLKKILANLVINDVVESDVVKICSLFNENGLDLEQLGVTGSILIGAQKSSSDIDLVFYSRKTFNHARDITKKLILNGDCFDLNERQWLESFDRRSCELSYKEYTWHEKRKFNKAIINQRKIDFNFVSKVLRSVTTKKYKKIEKVQLKVQIIDDTLAFDYPAEFSIRHPQISSIVSYTATYTGQAKVGEWVVVAGILEQDNKGVKRIVVGSSREAEGEYIKVITNSHLKLPSFSAVIFDMDGLVLDTEKTYFIAWQKAADEMGVSFSDEFCASLSGLQFQDIENQLINHYGVDFDLKRFRKLSGQFWREYVNQKGIPIKKGFFNLINKLKTKQIKFCLATNSGKTNALKCLELANITNLFSTVVSIDHVNKGKPEPDIFIEAAKELKQPVNQCLVLEDSVIGIQAAINASAPCVYIPSVFPVKRTTVNLADCFMMDLDQLAELIN
ncbi:MAG: HAD-IA family hydrolase [Methylococcaceae bacterium]|nr:HAD-IA family hydrolase [Methylococcaceae bacterium]